MAGKLKRTVNVAYWDTEQGANPPAIIGQIKGTPTIKYIKPSKKNKKNSNKQKNRFGLQRRKGSKTNDGFCHVEYAQFC